MLTTKQPDEPTFMIARPAILERKLDLAWVNWDLLYFVGITIVALIVRVYDLGGRALHHDESIHSWFTYNYFNGQGYAYDPVYHGPFLYHIGALAFFLFGASDTTTRIMPALFGTMVVGMCWWLRPFIGRWGAILAALLITFSPSITYYSRSLRHDIYAIWGIMLVFIGILGWTKFQRPAYLYAAAVGYAVAYSSHELTILGITPVFGLFIVLRVIYEYVYATAWFSISPQEALREDRPDTPFINGGRAFWRNPIPLVVSLAIFTVIYTLLFSSMFTYPKGILDGLYRGIAYWRSQQNYQRGHQPGYYYFMLLPIYEPVALLFGLLGGLYLLIRTSLFHNLGRPFRRLNAEQAISVTAAENDAAEADIPATAVEGIVTTPKSIIPLPFWPVALAFSLFWAVAVLAGISYAGEKMPWLNMQPTLPLIITAATAVGYAIERLNWRYIWANYGLAFVVSFLLFLACLAAFLGKLSSPGDATTVGTNKVLEELLAVIIGLAFASLASYLAALVGGRNSLRLLAVTFFALFLAYGIRSTWELNFYHSDVPVELLIYTQTSPDVPITVKRIELLSRDVTGFTRDPIQDPTGGHGLKIALDNRMDWPFQWYLRDYYNKSTTIDEATLTGAEKPDVIITDMSNKSMIDGTGDYTGVQYKLRWWFPEYDTYKEPDDPSNPRCKPPGEGDTGYDGSCGLSWNHLVDRFITSDGARSSWAAVAKYMLARDPGHPLGSYDYMLYVRNDEAARAGFSPIDTGLLNNGSGNGNGGNQGGNTNAAPNLFNEPHAGTTNGLLKGPRTIASAPDGGYYVLDTGNSRVQKFDKDGNFVTTWGKKGSGDGEFNVYTDQAGKYLGVDSGGAGPTGITVDKDGNVYVADTWNHRVQKFDGTGKFLLSWGTFKSIADLPPDDPQRATALYGPRAMIINTDGNLVLTDTGNKRVMVYDTSGKFVRQIGTPGPGNANGQLDEPIGLAGDSKGNIYVADTRNSRIQKFDKNGNFLLAWPVPSWNQMSTDDFLAVDGQDNVYASDPGAQGTTAPGTVFTFNSEGGPAQNPLSVPPGGWKRPMGMLYNKATNTMFIVDEGKASVVQIPLPESQKSIK